MSNILKSWGFFFNISKKKSNQIVEVTFGQAERPYIFKSNF